MNKIAVIIILLFANLIVLAQKKELKLEEVYTNPALYPVRMSGLQWIPKTNAYTYIQDSMIMKSIPLVKMPDRPILSLSKLNADWQAAGLPKQKRLPGLTWMSATMLQFLHQDSLYSYELSSGKINLLCYYPSESEYIKENPGTPFQVAYTKENNLWMSDGKISKAITTDDDPNLVNGQTVSRSEFGIVDGIFWSPKGSLLAYYKKDERKVGTYPMVDIESREAEVKMVKYPMAGMASEVVYVYVYNPETNQNIALDTKAVSGEYLTNLTWSPDEKYLYIQVLNRDQNHMKLHQYETETGKFVKTLFEEKNERYVEPEEGLFFLNNTVEQFVFLSERDGYKHAYLYNTKGELLKQLTNGKWMILSIEGFDEANAKLYFTATKDSPLENNLYALDMKSLAINRITTIAGTHAIQLSSDKRFVIDRYSNNQGIAAEYVLLSTQKPSVLKVLKQNVNPFDAYEVGETTIDMLKADDGTDLYYRMIKPANFDKEKKYPVIVYVYGGPHAQMVTNSWQGGSGYSLQCLAAKGYVIFTLDNRGSANRGFEFESIIHRQLGVVEMQDQMKGIAYLKTLTFVDTNRIGVQGWSYGGFMTTSLMLNHPKTFKVGVAGGPVIDWKYYEVMYGERYMDTPEQNPEGYKQSSTLNKVDQLEGQLMIIHGTIDPTVVWQNSQLFVKEAIKKQKMLDYFIYPDHEHNVRGYDRLHLERKIAKYFDDYL
jgi:dipeptidyl-peptidase-4